MLAKSLCDSSATVHVLLIIKTLLKIACIIVPIIIIIVTVIGFTKPIIDGKEESLKENSKLLVKRIIAGLIIAFIPLLLSFTFNNLLNTKLEFISCMDDASLEKYENLKKQEEQEAEAIKKAQAIEDEERLKANYELDQEQREKQKKVFEEYKATHGMATVSKLNYNNAKEIPESVLRNAKNSNLSVVIVDDEGNVIASKDPLVLREGGSTAKIFTGYAAVTLLNSPNDIVVNTSYAQNMPYMGTPDVKVGEKLSVAQAATKDFPGSSNITTANIAIAIGKKYHNSTSDKQAYFDGMEEINNLIKKTGCSNTKLASSSGVNYNYSAGKFLGNKNGIATGEYGISANDLALITIAAMKNENFSKGINYGKNGICTPPSNNSFFIKSGTQGYCHGVWGYNNNGKRYYVSILGVNCNKGDNKCQIFNDIYNWAVTL